MKRNQVILLIIAVIVIGYLLKKQRPPKNTGARRTPSELRPDVSSIEKPSIIID